MSPRRVRAMAHKEMLHILRDPRSLIMALAMPFVLLMLFGYALTLDVDRIPTLVYDANRTPESRELIHRFEGSRYFDILGYPSAYKVIEDAFDSEDALMGLVIPNDFSEKLLAGEVADVQVLLDGSDSNTANIALGYVNSVLQAHTAAIRADTQRRKLGRVIRPAAEPRIRIWYNHTLESKNFI
ncbi:MAG: ABC transporter permease, partial [bacterium]|nr:ABC transporter permease [bacterium]